MYKIILNGTTIYDSTVGASSPVTNPIVTLEDNRAGSFTFTVGTTSDTVWSEIKTRTDIIEVEKDGRLIFTGTPMEVKEDLWANKTYRCEGALTFLNNSIQPPTPYRGSSPEALLRRLIQKHNEQVPVPQRLTVGDVTMTGSVTGDTNYQSTMQAIQDLLVKQLGGHLRVRKENNTLYLDYLQTSPHTSQQTIELGKNLMDYASNLNDAKLITRIIPLGARKPETQQTVPDERINITSVNNDKNYLDAPSAMISRYGIAPYVLVNDKITTPTKLLAAGQDYLANLQFNSIWVEVKAIDLSPVTTDAPFELLDSVRITSDRHGMNRLFTLTKLELHLDKPEEDRLTFGSALTPTSLTARTNDQIQDAFELVPHEATILDKARENANNLIAGASGGYVKIDEIDGKPWRILIMDTDDTATARNVIQLNQNGIGFSTTGIDGPYTNAWTIDGNLTADAVTTGTMSANRVRTGNLTSENGDTSFNLDDGTLSTNGTLQIDSANFSLNKNGMAVATDFVAQNSFQMRWKDSQQTAAEIGQTDNQTHFILYDKNNNQEFFKLYTSIVNNAKWANVALRDPDSKAQLIGMSATALAPQIFASLEDGKKRSELGAGGRIVLVNGTLRHLKDGVVSVNNEAGDTTVSITGGAPQLNTAGEINVKNNGGTANIRLKGYDGNITCTSLTQTSSERYKEHINELTEEEAEKILDLRSVTFDYKDPDRGIDQRGLIAEEVEKIIPEIVVLDDEGKPEAINYVALIPYLIKMVQIQRTEIEKLKEEIGSNKK